MKNTRKKQRRKDMLKILGHAASSNVQKVLWCCGELDLPFERRDLAGPFGGNRAPEYLALNPNGLVPTVDDDGFILWESNAIVRYLAAKYGGAKRGLYPTDLAHRADAERWMDWQQTTLAAPMGVLFRALLRKPAEPMEPAALDAARAKAAASWEMLDRALADRACISGADLTVADIALGNAIHRWKRLPIERPAMQNLDAWYARLQERPAYRQYISSF
jgi:glutathione S-transferase